MNINHISIDFWNTLYDSSNGMQRNALRNKKLIESIDKYGLSKKNEEIQEAVKASWNFFEKIWKNEQRTPETTETVSYLWNYLKLPEDKEEIEKLVFAFEYSLLVYPPKLMDNAKEIIHMLSKNFKISLVSDTGFSPGNIMKELMKDDGILDYFDALSFSNETGVSKPHELAFKKVLEELDVSAKETLHIGDMERTDIAGAKNLNMFSALFINPGIISSEGEVETLADIKLKNWKELIRYIE